METARTWVELALAIAALAGVLLGMIRWLLGRLLGRLDQRIQALGAHVDARTAPIQPDANGGLSLPDVANATQILIDRQTQIQHSVEQLRESNDLTHRLLAQRVDGLNARLDDHASSPVHDRRRTDAGPPDGTSERRKGN